MQSTESCHAIAEQIEKLVVERVSIKLKSILSELQSEYPTMDFSTIEQKYIGNQDAEKSIASTRSHPTEESIQTVQIKIKRSKKPKQTVQASQTNTSTQIKESPSCVVPQASLLAVDPNTICMARKADNAQCTRRRKPNSDFCGKHFSHSRYGRVDDASDTNNHQDCKQIATVAEIIDGQEYFVDQFGVVFKYNAEEDGNKVEIVGKKDVTGKLVYLPDLIKKKNNIQELLTEQDDDD